MADRSGMGVTGVDIFSQCTLGKTQIYCVQMKVQLCVKHKPEKCRITCREGWPGCSGDVCPQHDMNDASGL